MLVEEKDELGEGGDKVDLKEQEEEDESPMVQNMKLS